MSLSKLCQVTRTACDIMNPMILSFYGAINSETSKLKSDNSIFTIADGVVQHILKDHLFGDSKFYGIVGEEDDSRVNLTNRPFSVDDLLIPDEFASLIETALSQVKALTPQLEEHRAIYQDLTVFIDPIDGTREFATGFGEQCSICVGFADRKSLKPVAGLVYRPITSPPTWAAGGARESYAEETLLAQKSEESSDGGPGLLTTNGSVSPFLVALMAELNYSRVKAGGVGNKMLLLLEGRGAVYIQDRGVSRWDSCAAQAVLEARGGCLCKLSSFMKNKEMQTYSYAGGDVNLDFESGLASLTPFNARDKALVLSREKGTPPLLAMTVEQVRPYSNLCGLLALAPEMCRDARQLDVLHAALLRANAQSPASFD